MKIHLLYFPGCPNVDAARAAVRQALASEQLDLSIQEINVEDPQTPAWARGWGSPTILIDGKEIYDQESSGAPACRVYRGGAPSVEVIRSRLRLAPGSGNRRLALPMIGAIVAAVAASTCCLVPAVLAVLGVSGVGIASRFAPYRTGLLIASTIALLVGFWLAYRRTGNDCGCEIPRRRRATRVGLWLTTLLIVVLAAYPLIGSDRATAGSPEGDASATLILKVIGMDCKRCTGSIATSLKNVPGVTFATVDFASGIAIVRYTGRGDITNAAIEAVEREGYRAELQRDRALDSRR